MKNLKDHVILYDADCPMCCAYTKGFVKSGMLPEDGRMPYQCLPEHIASKIDRKRSVDEIALVNKVTGQVAYGTESLFKVIGNSVPALKPLFNFTTFKKIVGIAYKFISFNRRVIIPVKKSEATNVGFEPSFNGIYRFTYLIFAVFITSFVLYKFSFWLHDILPVASFWRELVICAGQIFWQLAVIRMVNKRASWDYLGNMMTVSLAGGILLSLVLLIGNAFGVVNLWFYGVAFGLVVAAMMAEHLRRTSILGLPWTLTASWLIYRVGVLIILYLIYYV